MKNKAKVIILGLFIVALLVTIYMNQPVKTKTEIRCNTIHRKEDIDFVMTQAIQYYEDLNCKVYSVYYDENKSQQKEHEYVERENYQEVIIVYLEYKTGFFNAPIELGNNQYFLDYMYIAGKNAQGIWEWRDSGYV